MENNKIEIASFSPIAITLHVNELNSPIERYILTKWIKKKTESNCMLSARDPT